MIVNRTVREREIQRGTVGGFDAAYYANVTMEEPRMSEYHGKIVDRFCACGEKAISSTDGVTWLCAKCKEEK